MKTREEIKLKKRYKSNNKLYLQQNIKKELIKAYNLSQHKTYIKLFIRCKTQKMLHDTEKVKILKKN